MKNFGIKKAKIESSDTSVKFVRISPINKQITLLGDALKEFGIEEAAVITYKSQYTVMEQLVLMNMNYLATAIYIWDHQIGNMIRDDDTDKKTNELIEMFNNKSLEKTFDILNTLIENGSSKRRVKNSNLLMARKIQVLAYIRHILLFTTGNLGNDSDGDSNDEFFGNDTEDESDSSSSNEDTDEEFEED